ncbi:hypothetical protein Curi_c03740 [Gottschalkia acidurici 9a]|uniref:Uncharacterized protein n=1 Tax=Gottschalkia acidurici (strain ATCC 7906 / DSM 604 / BCRC 14475 / CIP 104303 / KCTC 5404 / NCIMB 10678 / 9a) TaxID=1128398 RepID=K0AW35_GOTA9|nr:hypothetical protein [Gottschalkia acidurici]AFS77449.1 hypothetical protein Curi_c03740 [Gottschalkia acidurici 9a]
MSSKYKEYWYWGNMVLTDQPLWNSSFKNLSLTKDSIFIYSFIMDKNKDVFKNSWAYYPDIKSLLGFIEYVFLPTAFFTWLDNETEGFKTPIATVDEVLNVMVEKDRPESDILTMREQIKDLRTLWLMDDSDNIRELKNFSKEFNKQWKEYDDRLLYFRVFQRSTEIGEFVFTGEENNFFEEIMEEDIGMTKIQWKETCENIYDNKFLKNRFIDILNHKVGCLV